MPARGCFLIAVQTYPGLRCEETGVKTVDSLGVFTILPSRAVAVPSAGPAVEHYYYDATTSEVPTFMYYTDDDTLLHVYVPCLSARVTLG